LKKINNKVKIIFMSGQNLEENGGKKPGTSFLKKPFSIEEVEQIVDEVSI